MHIVFAASECKPWAQTGGLAEVLTSLPAALAGMGHQVTSFVPYYRHVAKQLPVLPVTLASLTVAFATYQRFPRLLDGGLHGGVQVYFVDCPELFDRAGFYGTPGGDYTDNWERFALLSRVVIEACKVLGVPDVFHAHDWEAAMLPVYLRSLYYFDPVLRQVPCVFSIHNAEYQGRFPPETMQQLGLPWSMFTPESVEAYGEVNYLKGGSVYADALTTVSPTYAEELQQEGYGAGLHGIFRARRQDLTGILNGVDYGEWDPERDSRIAAHFSAGDLSGKRECRRDLLHACKLDHVRDETAVIGIVSRLTAQKGFDLLLDSLQELMHEDVVLIVCGSGEEFYERMLREAAARYADKLRVMQGFDDVTEHKLQAGCDMLLMPSLYEPGGLSQLHSMRYGTVPVVRSTGGLRDTVIEGSAENQNGFCFEGTSPVELLGAVRRALIAFADRGLWEVIMRRGITSNVSWPLAAARYVDVYRRCIEQRSWV